MLLVRLMLLVVVGVSMLLLVMLVYMVVVLILLVAGVVVRVGRAYVVVHGAVDIGGVSGCDDVAVGGVFDEVSGCGVVVVVVICVGYGDVGAYYVGIAIVCGYVDVVCVVTVRVGAGSVSCVVVYIFDGDVCVAVAGVDAVGVCVCCARGGVR